MVDPEAKLAAGVQVGPCAFIAAGVEIGEDTVIGAGAVVEGPCRIGRGNLISPHASIGSAPQDLTYRGEPTRLEIGDRNQFREFCTINRGTVKGGGVTVIGNDNLFMAYIHVGHDSRVGDRTVFVNNATIAGHVEVHDDVSIGAFSAVHQFCRIGRHAYLGGYTVVTMDVLPFVKVVGQSAAFYGLNSIGMRRKGFTAARSAKLAKAVRILVRSGLNTRQALERLREESPRDEDFEYLIAFVAGSTRGIHKATPRGGRSGAAASAGAAASPADGGEESGGKESGGEEAGGEEAGGEEVGPG